MKDKTTKTPESQGFPGFRPDRKTAYTTRANPPDEPACGIAVFTGGYQRGHERVERHGFPPDGLSERSTSPFENLHIALNQFLSEPYDPNYAEHRAYADQDDGDQYEDVEEV